MNLDERLLRWGLHNRLPLFLTICLGVAAGVLTVLQAGLLSQVIGQVFLFGRSLLEVTNLMALMLGVIVLRSALAWAGEITGHSLAARVKSGLRQELINRLIGAGPAYLRNHESGELVNLALEGIEALDAYFSQYLPQLALAALVPLTFLCFVIPRDPLSGLVLLLTAPLIPIFMILISGAAQAQTRRQWQSLGRMSAYFLDVIQGLHTLKALGRSQEQAQGIERVSDQYRSVTMGVLRVTFLSALALELVATLSTAVVAVEIGLRLLYGRLPFEQAFFVLLLAPEFYLPLRLLGTRFHAGMAGVTTANRIFVVLEGIEKSIVRHEKDMHDKPGLDSVTGGALIVGRGASLAHPVGCAVEFRNVAFAYDTGSPFDTRPALDDISFCIEPGEKVALVGPSGAGKSSIAGLMLRFIRPEQGQIFINGQSSDTLGDEEWRAQIAWLPQHPYLFNDTVAANIRLARPEASLEDVIRAARAAQADAFIQRLPQGFDTLVGEHGARLSRGEAQRIALARAYLKDASMLILDEPTAHLDPETEIAIQDAMAGIMEGRTVLVIAHRLSTVQSMDKIIVLEAGRVSDMGTHSELLCRRGLYYRLVTAYTGERQSEQPISAGGTRKADLAWPERTSPSSQQLRGSGVKVDSSMSMVASPLPIVVPIEAGAGSPFEEGKGSGLSAVLTRLLRLVHPFTGRICLSVLLGAATVGCGIGLMTTSAYIISAAALHPSVADLQLAIVGVRFFGISRGLFRYLERLISHDVTMRVLGHIRVSFYRALEPLAPARLMTYRSGDLLARIIGDVASLENFYVRALAPPLVAVIVWVGSSLFLAKFSYSFALALLVFWLLSGLALPMMMRKLGQKPGKALVSARSQLSEVLVDCLQGLPDLLAYGQAGREEKQVTQAGAALAQAQWKVAMLSGWQSGLFLLLTNLAMLSVLALAIPLVSDGKLPGVYLAVIVLAALTSFEALQPLPLAAQTLESNLQAARRLFEVVDAQPEVKDLPVTLPAPAEMKLEVSGLSFGYPLPIRGGGLVSSARSQRSQRPADVGVDVLQDINFSLVPGRRLAVVGPSGVGKTTLVNLLLRFWEFDQGQIYLDGRDLRFYAQDSVRKQIGVVSQNTYLFCGMLRDNLRIARPSASEEELVEAARQAQLHDFIQALPEKYDTWIGEHGLRLSGGERQRVAIARVLLKKAPLLILDEPTVNLDALTEQALWSALKELMPGRASLLITHRLIGMEEMDEILVLRQGRVVERGRHADLLAASGYYRRMWDLQRQAIL